MAAPAGADALVAQLERAEAAALHCADASAPASAAQDGLAALEALLGADVDAELLAATGLGKRVRKLAKAGEAAGAAAMSLADKARQVMDAWVAKVKAATPADDAAAAEPAAKRAKGEPASEPPRAAAAAVKRETLAPPPPTKDPARDKLRELLTTALELAGAPACAPLARVGPLLLCSQRRLGCSWPALTQPHASQRARAWRATRRALLRRWRLRCSRSTAALRPRTIRPSSGS